MRASLWGWTAAATPLSGAEPPSRLVVWLSKVEKSIAESAFYPSWPPESRGRLYLSIRRVGCHSAYCENEFSTHYAGSGDNRRCFAGNRLPCTKRTGDGPSGPPTSGTGGSRAGRLPPKSDCAESPPPARRDDRRRRSRHRESSLQRGSQHLRESGVFEGLSTRSVQHRRDSRETTCIPAGAGGRASARRHRRSCR